MKQSEMTHRHQDRRPDADRSGTGSVAVTGRGSDHAGSARDTERRIRFIDASDGNLLGVEVWAPTDERFARSLALTLERLSLERLLTKRMRRGAFTVYREYVAPQGAARLDSNQSAVVRTALLVLIATGETPGLSDRSGIRAALHAELGNLETGRRRTA